MRHVSLLFLCVNLSIYCFSEVERQGETSVEMKYFRCFVDFFIYFLYPVYFFIYLLNKMQVYNLFYRDRGI